MVVYLYFKSNLELSWEYHRPLFNFIFSIQQLSWGGFSLTHITYSIFLFVKWREEKKVKFPLWAVSMLGCSWPRTFRNFSIKEGGTTCSKWASYLSILRSLSYATMETEVLWSCINPRTTDTRWGNWLHCTAKNQISIPNF